MSTLLVWALLQVGAPKKPVAMVLSCAADCQVQRPENPKPDRLSDGDHLFEKDKVIAGKSGLKVVMLLGSRTVMIAPSATATLGPKEFAPTSAIQPVPRRKGAPGLDKVPQLIHSETIAGVVETFFPPQSEVPTGRTSPLANSRVLAARPTFRWPAVKEATGYEISLFKLAEAKPEWTATTAKNSYTPPPKQALSEGQYYLWRVVATLKTGKKETVVDNFSVALLDKKKREQLKVVEPFKTSADPEDWLMAAATYQAFRVADEAFPLYERVAAKRPGQVGLLWKIHSYCQRAQDKGKAKEVEKELRKLGAWTDFGT